MREMSCSWSGLFGFRGLAVMSLTPFLLLMIASCAGGGGGEISAEEVLRRSLQRARSLVEEGQSLSFDQSITLRLLTGAGDLTQSTQLKGDIRLPHAERYVMREAWGGIALDGEREAEELSLVTLDAGKSAYVRGTHLEKELGMGGWLYIQNAQGKVRFLDYLKLLEDTAAHVREIRELEPETLDGKPCRRLLLEPDVESALRGQLESDPSLRERLQGAEELPEISMASSEIWIDNSDYLPLRVYSKMVLRFAGSGERMEVEMRVDFTSYGAELRPPLDAPAVYTVVELP